MWKCVSKSPEDCNFNGCGEHNFVMCSARLDKIDRFLKWVKSEYDIAEWEDSDWLEAFEEWNEEHHDSRFGISELNEVKKRR